jgi:hypothetical protein
MTWVTSTFIGGRLLADVRRRDGGREVFSFCQD